MGPGDKLCVDCDSALAAKIEAFTKQEFAAKQIAARTMLENLGVAGEDLMFPDPRGVEAIADGAWVTLSLFVPDDFVGEDD